VEGAASFPPPTPSFIFFSFSRRFFLLSHTEHDKWWGWGSTPFFRLPVWRPFSSPLVDRTVPFFLQRLLSVFRAWAGRTPLSFFFLPPMTRSRAPFGRKRSSFFFAEPTLKVPRVRRELSISQKLFFPRTQYVAFFLSSSRRRLGTVGGSCVGVAHDVFGGATGSVPPLHLRGEEGGLSADPQPRPSFSSHTHALSSLRSDRSDVQHSEEFRLFFSSALFRSTALPWFFSPPGDRFLSYSQEPHSFPQLPLFPFLV